MTCFWDGIMNSLEKEDRNILGIKDRNIYTLIDKLQKISCPTKEMKWQNKLITESQINENIEHIKAYNKHNAPMGYLCSTFDPFLFLLSYKLKKSINFIYCGNKIRYDPPNPKGKCLNYKCNRGHFWFNKK